MNCNICDKLKQLSRETWERIEFVRSRRGFKIYETTLTQNILFELRRFQEACHNYSISMYEAKDEKTNGNDIELIIQINDDNYIILPTQAKLLYSDLKYKMINHKGNVATYQLDDLINYATSIRAIPMYLFYNYLPSSSSLTEYGCTMIKADYIKTHFSPDRTTPKSKRWKIPSFSDLKVHAKPWHEIICNFLNGSSTINIEQMRKYNLNELINNHQWKSFSNNYEGREKIVKDNLEYGYHPRFRIVISKNDRE